MKVLFVRAIIENRVNLQGIAEKMEVGGSKQQQHHKINNVILKNVSVAFKAMDDRQLLQRTAKAQNILRQKMIFSMGICFLFGLFKGA